MPSSSSEGPGEAGRGSDERMDGGTSKSRLEECSSVASQPDDRDDMDTTSSEADRNGVLDNSASPENTNSAIVSMDTTSSEADDNGVIEGSSASSENTNNSATVTTAQQFAAEEPEDEEMEKESEDEGEGEEGTAKPGLPKFLRRHVKISEYIPVPIQATGSLCMEECESLLEAPSQVTPFLKTKPHQFLAGNDSAKKESDKKQPPSGNSIDLAAFFQSTAGEFIIGLGLSRAFEVVKRDLVRHKEREMKKASGGTQEMIDEHRKLTEAYKQAKNENAPFTFKMKSCKVCDFKTESSLVLDGHLLTPHFTSRRELQCTFCYFATRDAKAIVFHMEAIHNKKPTMEPPQQVYECPMCPFETNLKAKATGHVRHCQKYFNNNVNQKHYGDYPIPGVTAKPVTIEDIKAHEKFLALTNSSRSQPKAKTTQKRTYAALSRSKPVSQPAQRGVPPSLYQLLTSATSLNQNTESGGPRLALIQISSTSNPEFQVVRGASELIPLLNAGQQLAVTLAGGPTYSSDDISKQQRAPARPQGQPQGSAGQRPRMLAAVESGGSGASSISCEICDCKIKDMDQFRTHMQWIHKVKLHTRVLSSRPPLNCQKCQRRFYTDQGLERHLLGAHGLVTTNMQELVNLGKDAGRCTVCGRTYGNKLVAHMSHIHKTVLKAAHLSYKCTVCTATFNLYKLFESHVYMVHSNAVKLSSSTADSDERPADQPAASTSVLAATANTAGLSKSSPKREPKESASGSAKSARKEHP